MLSNIGSVEAYRVFRPTASQPDIKLFLAEDFLYFI